VTIGLSPNFRAVASVYPIGRGITANPRRAADGVSREVPDVGEIVEGLDPEKVIDDVRARFGAGVKAVVTTSDSWPHIGGMREYVARGVPTYALDLNAPILNRLFAAPYLSFPDALAKAPRSANLQLVRARMMLGGVPNRIELYPLRTVSGERQMLVYFPEHRLLYTSDLFTILPNGQVFLPQQVSEAVGAVAREHLAVDRAFGMHYDVLPWSRVVDSARPPKYD